MKCFNYSTAKLVLLTVLFTSIVLSQQVPTFRVVYHFSVSETQEFNGDLLKVSLWGGVKSLWERKAVFLAVMVACWSGVWPLLKVLGFTTKSFLSESRSRNIFKLILLIGKMSFLDVYAVLLLVLIIRIPKISGCQQIFSFELCKEVGFVMTEALSGLLFFAGTIAVTTLLFRVQESNSAESVVTQRFERFDFSESSKVSKRRIMAVQVTRLVLLLGSLSLITVATFYFPVFAVDLGTGVKVAKLSPKHSEYSLADMYFSLLLGKTGGQAVRIAESLPRLPVPYSLAFLTLSTCVTISVIPLLQCIIQIALLLFNWGGDIPRRTEQNYKECAINRMSCIMNWLHDWSHLEVFLFALALVSVEITGLSENFNLPSDLKKEIDITDGKFAKITVTLLNGFYFLTVAVVLRLLNQCLRSQLQKNERKIETHFNDKETGAAENNPIASDRQVETAAYDLEPPDESIQLLEKGTGSVVTHS
mmetsp:Transcript_11308/g.13699  ORF Transcript_11308/g.13699 Transcript_11308/m.13699 type:complete len:476 (+) Transcript_11308:187-1614(+)|eukprot:CAMPEP_0184041910 /NCGR_PEP_ID=MMETSP0955-20130417/64718_1 /TAXON_ID=627963 /ORGANISM="Aplanochytrium sp, Strain PBS07" /LENGTH=475 /DNA_ID=CAMNT_0026332479 /DNA_START=88 /DNA_END=1515 /DNA_ORIENTATION=+